MLGAIIGDIAGSRFEFNNHRSKQFNMFDKACYFTDDTVMTCAIADALMNSNLRDMDDVSANAIRSMKSIGRNYPNCGYGGTFGQWIYSDSVDPYWSFGNGAAMRVSACGWLFDDIYDVRMASRAVTAVTHDHPEGIKGAEAVAVAIMLARTGSSIQDIRDCMSDHYYYIDFTLDQIRNTYQFNESCQDTVPQALEAFYESTGFEDAIRNAVSIGGDSDTIAAITGSIAEAYYGIPEDLKQNALKYLDDRLSKIVYDFYERMEITT